MNSFEKGPSLEQLNKETVIPDTEEEKKNSVETFETTETTEFREQAVLQEKTSLEKFKGRAKEVAVVLMMVSTLSFGTGTLKEVYAGEKKESVKVEQIKKEIEQRNFVIKKETFDYIVNFSKDARKVMEEQNVDFVQTTGDFWFKNERVSNPESALGYDVQVLEIEEVDGVTTNRIEVTVDELELPGGHTKKQLKIEIYNTDGSIETFTMLDGRITNYTRKVKKK